MEVAKLRAKDLPAYRKLELMKQKGLCLMCGELITENDEVLDHDHKLGHCRGVVHRTCNVIEGKIINASVRGGSRTNLPALLRGLADYYESDFSKNPLHPTFKTELDKEIKALERKKRAAKKAETKERHAAKIRELKSLKTFYIVE